MQCVVIVCVALVAAYFGGVLGGLFPSRSHFARVAVANIVALAAFVAAIVVSEPVLTLPHASSRQAVLSSVFYLAAANMSVALAMVCAHKLLAEQQSRSLQETLEAPRIAMWFEKAKHDLGVTLPGWARNSLQDAYDAYYAASWRKDARDKLGVELPDWVTSAHAGCEAFHAARWRQQSLTEFGVDLPSETACSCNAAHEAYLVNMWRYRARRELGVELPGDLHSVGDLCSAYYRLKSARKPTLQLA